MRIDVITAGEAMALFAAQQPGPLEQVESFARSTAGAELNVAIGLARLGLRVAYLTRLGDDSFGRSIAALLHREGIDASHAGLDPRHPTGFMLKSRATDGSDPRIEYFRRGSAASRLGAADMPRAAVAAARHLHLTGIFPAVSPTTREFVFELAAAARQGGLTISFDPNLRPSLWPSHADMVECLDRLARLADWVLPGLEEGRVLSGQHSAQGIADHYLACGARAVVVKLGPDGAFFATPDERGHAPGVPVPRVVDTVGAGDGFAVGVVSALLEGLPLAQAAARGNRIGARVVQFPGDSDGLPTRDQLASDEPGSGVVRSVVFMGVSGCGKSTLAARVAAELGLPLIEGDDHHSAASRSKMGQGIALDDADRDAWLQTLAGLLRQAPATGVALSCSALKRSYRERLRAASPGLRFVFLDLPFEEAQRRVAARAGSHFFSPALVASQFATLEPPLGEPGVLRVDALAPVPVQTRSVLEWLAAPGG